MCTTTSRCDAGLVPALPRGCPGAEAKDSEGQIFYRLVRCDPPEASDFLSHFEMSPERDWTGLECKARALSLWKKTTQADKIRKLPAHRNEGYMIAALQTAPGFGLIRVKNGHVSWWRCGAFDPIEKSRIVDQ